MPSNPTFAIYLSGLDLGDVVHNVELQIVSAPAVAGRSSHPGGRVPPALQYPGSASHGKRGDGFSPIAPEQGGRHPGDRDDGMPPTAGLRCRRLRERREESSLPRRWTGTLSAAFAQPSHLFTAYNLRGD